MSPESLETNRRAGDSGCLELRGDCRDDYLKAVVRPSCK